eukprot:scaffold387_cov63-Phaeocystis_antarctica.AAC.1
MLRGGGGGGAVRTASIRGVCACAPRQHAQTFDLMVRALSPHPPSSLLSPLSSLLVVLLGWHPTVSTR